MEFVAIGFERRIILVIKINNKNKAQMECENKIDASSNRGDWNHFKIAQTTLEQHTGVARS